MEEENDINTNDTEVARQPIIRVSGFASQPTTTNIVSALNKLQNQSDANNHNNDITSDTQSQNNSVAKWIKQDNGTSNSPIFVSEINKSAQTNNSTITSPSSGGQKTVRRRIRRKQNSPDDQAEALTEMSVRGLNLFRYASVQDGVYQCTECLKENVQKTFKNKYSFQRHAFLYHEGTQRKVFPCPVCRKEFSRPDKMKNHMKMTHECYMPKECKYPLPLIMAGSSALSQPETSQIAQQSVVQKAALNHSIGTVGSN